MSKQIILFDMDRTLVDTDKTSEIHKQKILELLGNQNADEYQKIKDDYKKSLSNEREYDPRIVLKLVCNHFGFDNLDSLLNVYYGKENWCVYKDAVFADVITTLENLKNNFDLGIYSEAIAEFQYNKFYALDLDNYFNPELVFILPAKDNLEAVKKIPQGAVVIDDKLTICEFLTKNGIKVIWLNRKDESINPNFQTIHSLLELPKILLENDKQTFESVIARL